MQLGIGRNKVPLMCFGSIKLGLLDGVAARCRRHRTAAFVMR